MIRIKSEHSLTEQGKRANNEDNLGMRPGSVYVVCDGVGGAEKGEVASMIVVESFLSGFADNPTQPISGVLQNAEKKLHNYLLQHPEARGMATTLTFSQVRPDGILVAWVGDSRIYQFRAGQIIFRTEDHSWVNEALRNGLLTAAEAINHPKSNVITRAIQGASNPTSADQQLLTDVKAGDYFFHCTDGILESWKDEDLSALFLTMGSPSEILHRIRQECQLASKDNFSAIVYQVGEVNIAAPTVLPKAPSKPMQAHPAAVSQPRETYRQSQPVQANSRNDFASEKRSNKTTVVGLLALCVVLSGIIVYLLFRPSNEVPTSGAPAKRVEKPQSGSKPNGVSTTPSNRQQGKPDSKPSVEHTQTNPPPSVPSESESGQPDHSPGTPSTHPSAPASGGKPLPEAKPEGSESRTSSGAPTNPAATRTTGGTAVGTVPATTTKPSPKPPTPKPPTPKPPPPKQIKLEKEEIYSNRNENR